MKCKSLCWVGCAVTMLGWGTGAAQATTMKLDIGGTPFFDNIGLDVDPAPGQMNVTTSVGNFSVVITVATSNSPGSGSGGLLQITSLDIRNTSPGSSTLVIKLGDIDFTVPGSPGSFIQLDSSVGGTFVFGHVGDTASFQSFADPANGLLNLSAASTAPLPFTRSTTFLTEAFSGFNDAVFVKGGLYSLSNVITTSLSSGGQLNISGTTETVLVPDPGTGTVIVPEPASLSLLGLGSLLILRRRR